MFAAHPETQKMFPRFANVPVAELGGNKYFQQAVYNCMFGLTVIIKNLDTPDIVATLLKNMATPSFYVDGPSAAAQLDETTRLFNEVMAEELGAAFTPEVKSAFTELLDWVHSVLAKANDDGVPTAQDKQIIRDNINILKAKKSNWGAKTMLKSVTRYFDLAIDTDDFVPTLPDCSRLTPTPSNCSPSSPTSLCMNWPTTPNSWLTATSSLPDSTS
jgi:hypothetical protein